MKNLMNGWRRGLAVVAVAVLIVGLTAVVGHPARAAALSSSCESLNGPLFDAFGAGGFGGGTYFAGERLIFSAGPPDSGPPTMVTLKINGSLEDSATYPGTVTYEVPHDGPLTYDYQVISGQALWDVRCLPPETSPAAGPPYTDIYLMSDAEQAPYLSVPNAVGATACGAFNVNGWGA